MTMHHMHDLLLLQRNCNVGISYGHCDGHLQISLELWVYISHIMKLNIQQLLLEFTIE